MIDVQRIDEERGRSCRSQCSGNLCTDMATLANTSYDDFTLAVQHHVNGTVEVLVHLRYQIEDGLCFIFQTLYSYLSCCHLFLVFIFQ